MNAMQAVQRDAYDIEAEAYCRTHIPRATAEDVRQLAASLCHRAYLEAIQPLVKAKADLYSCRLPKILIDEEGRVETKYEFTEAEQKLLDDCDHHIREMAQNFRAADEVSDD